MGWNGPFPLGGSGGTTTSAAPIRRRIPERRARSRPPGISGIGSVQDLIPLLPESTVTTNTVYRNAQRSHVSRVRSRPPGQESGWLPPATLPTYERVVTSHTLDDSERGKIFDLAVSGAIIVPVPGSGFFNSGWYCWVRSEISGVLTAASGTSIDGAASVTLNAGGVVPPSLLLFSTGANWFTLRGAAQGGSGISMSADGTLNAIFGSSPGSICQGNDPRLGSLYGKPRDGRNGRRGRPVPGNQGQTGKAGADGTDGTNGTNGTDGTNGIDGISIRGQRGHRGNRGRAVPGVPGQTGNTGATGAPGTNGTNGTNGTDGTDGTNGISIRGHRGHRGNRGRPIPGSQGQTGNTGPTGANGTNGTNGTNGRDGYTLVAKRAKTGRRGRPIPGNQGEQGIQGIQGPAGTSVTIVAKRAKNGKRGRTAYTPAPAPVPYQNFLINGDFAISQRLGSSGSPTMGTGVNRVYTADRWATEASADGIGYSQSGGGGDSNGGNYTVGANNAKLLVYQILENGTTLKLSNGPITFAVDFQTDGLSTTTTYYRIAILKWVGTANSVANPLVPTTWGSAGTNPTWATSVSVIAQSQVVPVVGNGNAATVSVTTTIPAGVTNVIFAIWTDSALQTSTTDVFGPLLARVVVGSVPPPWIPPDPALELIRCQRFYETSFSSGTAPEMASGIFDGALCCFSAAASTSAVSVPFAVAKRTASYTPVTYNPTQNNANWRTNANGSNGVAATSRNGTGGFLASCTTAQIATWMIHWSVDCEL